MLPAGFAAAGGGDANRISLNQAWAAVRADQKKLAAAEKAATEQLQAALTSSKAKSKR
jgi:hypothetical protein